MKIMFEIPKNLEVRYINEEIGVGVFTTVDIEKDSLIETCYCLEMNSLDVTHPSYDYLFTQKDTEKQLLPFGYGSLYNHSDEPNMICDYEKSQDKILTFIAIRNIKADEELRHYYGKKYWLARKKKMI